MVAEEDCPGLCGGGSEEEEAPPVPPGTVLGVMSLRVPDGGPALAPPGGAQVEAFEEVPRKAFGEVPITPGEPTEEGSLGTLRRVFALPLLPDVSPSRSVPSEESALVELVSDIPDEPDEDPGGEGSSSRGTTRS